MVAKAVGPDDESTDTKAALAAFGKVQESGEEKNDG